MRYRRLAPLALALVAFAACDEPEPTVEEPTVLDALAYDKVSPEESAAADLPAETVPAPEPCPVLVPHADDPTSQDALAALDADDYRGGVWYDSDGDVIGYAAAEDSAVYPSEECAEASRAYPYDDTTGAELRATLEASGSTVS